VSGLYTRARRSSSSTASTLIVLYGMAGIAGLLFLSLLWWSFSPVLGQGYAAIRMLETLTLWKFTSWGSYFLGTPRGQPFAFVSVYKSSVGFGLFFALTVAGVGYLAYRQRGREVLLPTPSEKPASLKMAEIIAQPVQKTALMPDGIPGMAEPRRRQPLRDPLANPFLGLRDLRDAGAVSTSLARLPWVECAVLLQLIEAIVPPVQPNARDTLKKVIRSASEAHHKSEGEPPQADVLRDRLTDAITDLSGRENSQLDAVHAVLAEHPLFEAMLAPLTGMALTVGKLDVASYAWLCRINPDIHASIVRL
jgi:hypothetical protein